MTGAQMCLECDRMFAVTIQSILEFSTGVESWGFTGNVTVSLRLWITEQLQTGVYQLPRLEQVWKASEPERKNM